MRIAAALLLLCLPPLAASQAPEAKEIFEEGQRAQGAGDYQLAAAKFAEALRLDPKLIAARANLAVAYSSLGRFDEAIEQYQLVLAKFPENFDLRRNLALVYYKKGAFEEAARLFTGLYRERPSDLGIATLLGDCDFRLQRYGDAVALLTPVEAANPDNLDVAWVLGASLVSSGQAREGLARVERVAHERQSADAYLMTAQAYLKLTYFDQAQQAAREAIRLNPNLPGAFTLSGIIADYQDDLDAAVAALEKGLQANSEDFDAHLYLGAICYVRRQLDAAREHFNKALALQPNSYVARYELALVDLRENHLEAAARGLEAAARSVPDWLPPHIELAALYYRLKRPGEGAREREIVERLTEEERQRKAASPVISPILPSQ